MSSGAESDRRTVCCTRQVFGLVHSVVGQTEKILRGVSVHWVTDDTNARCRNQGYSVNFQRLLNLLQNVLRNTFSIFPAPYPGKDEDELISAESGHNIGFTQAGLHSPGQCFQELVSSKMSERIVDFLELIQVEKHDG